jgi:hypothetical protein
MKSLFLNIYSIYPQSGDDQMYGTTKDQKWPKCSPASLRDQAIILIQRTVSRRERSLLPLPKHLLFLIADFPPGLRPLLHFHFHQN